MTVGQVPVGQRNKEGAIFVAMLTMNRAWLILFAVLALFAIALAALVDDRWSGWGKSGRCDAGCQPQPPKCNGSRWGQQNVVSDVALIAPTTDPDVVNPWGVAVAPCEWLNRSSPSSSSSSQFERRCVNSSSSSSASQQGPSAWVAANGSGLLIEYEMSQSNASCDAPLMTRLRSVIVPAATSGTGFPTGVVINGCRRGFPVPIVPSGGTGGSSSSSSGSTVAASILTATEDGLIAAWSPAAGGSDPVTATVVVTSVDAVYKGLALLDDKLYVANFHSGQVEVYSNTFAAVGTFTDTALLGIGYAPFNVAAIGQNLYVSFAKQDISAHDDVSGIGNGFVDVFDSSGTLVKRLISRGHLNSPWAMAPYGRGELLVGNFGDGLINRYCICTGRFLGPLVDCCRRPIVIDGVWGVACAAPCKRINCGPCRRARHAPNPCAQTTLLVAAGINAEADGLITLLRRPRSKH